MWNLLRSFVHGEEGLTTIEITGLAVLLLGLAFAVMRLATPAVESYMNRNLQNLGNPDLSNPIN